MGRRSTRRSKAVFLLATVVGSLVVSLPSASAATTDKVVFRGNDADSSEIFIMDSDGTNRTQLTSISGTKSNLQPDITRDGTKIAYQSNLTLSTHDIWTMNADGSNQVQLTTAVSDDEHPDWSPDGSKIAYVSGSVDEIWTMNADGTNKVRLSPMSASDTTPSWSPDGTKIAFSGLTPIDANNYQHDIYVMNADGTNRTQLTADTGTDQFPVWSADGTKLAFVSNRVSSTNQIFVMDADGSNETQMTFAPGRNSNPSWAPHSKITFDSTRVAGEVTIYEMNADGTGVTKITPSGFISETDASRSLGVPDTTAPSAPTFTGTSPASPHGSATPKIKGSAEAGSTVRLYTNATCSSAVAASGSASTFAGTGITVTVGSGTSTYWATATDSSSNTSACSSTSISYTYAPGDITFSSDGDGVLPYDIYTMNADGTGRTRLTTEVGGNLSYESTFSPDGTRILWVRHDSASGQSDLWVMNADGTNKTRITNTGGTFREHGPEFSPDGSKIVFYNYGGDVNQDIWVINADGSGQTRLTTDTRIDNEPRWSPDGTKIVWMSESDGGEEVWVMNADGTGKTQLTNNNNNTVDDFPVWSPDGTKIMFTSNRNGNSDLFTMNPDGTGVTQITNDAVGEVMPSWNPGNKVTYNQGNAIYEMNADGTGKTQLTAGGAISDYWPERAATSSDVDITPPAAPTVSSVTPASPANNNSPRIVGSAEAGSTVKLYTNGTCSSAVAASGSASDFASPGLQVSVSNNSSQTYYATATDAANNVSACSSTSVTYVEDSTAPTTSITSGPSALIITNTATFGFSSNDAGATFECSLDGAAFASCTSTKAYTNLSNSTHTFQVRATDPTGNVEAVPAMQTFRVDTRRVLFTSNRDGNWDVYTMKADGSGRTQLTFGGNNQDNYEPEWSPNAAKVVWVKDSGNYDIYSMNADGTGQTQLTSGNQEDRFPTFKPDGSKILFARGGIGSQTLWTMNPDGTGQTQLSATLGDSFPQWSPDGTKILVQTGSAITGDIYVMNANGTGRTQLTTYAGFDQYPSWSPDGSKIVWISDRAATGQYDLYTMNADGSNQTRLTTDAGAELAPSWNPGSSILFESNRDGVRYIHEVNADGSGFRRITNPDGFQHAYPMWEGAGGGGGDTTPPALPTLTSVSPAGPANNNSPSVKGTAEAGSTVRVYTDAACLGATVGTGTAADFGGGGITVTVANDSTSSFYATAMDAAGNPSGCSSSTVSYVEDSTAPNTAIDSGPTGPVANNDPSFGFSSPEASATFECSLDGAVFASCASTKQYTDLSDGSHTFEVRAVDGAGNADATPAARSFTIDTTAPDTSIDSGPSGRTANNDPQFTFSSADGTATFECSVGGAGFAACASPLEFTDLADGDYTLAVRSVDTLGNADQTAASRSFTVDTAAPDTSIDSGPTGLTPNNDPSFGFSSDDPTAGFECSLDGSAFSTCDATEAFTDLGEGDHTLAVRAVDPVGNTDQSPAVRNFRVDTVASDTSISSGPTGTITTASATFEFSSAEGVSFECKLDSGNFESCTSPETYSSLAQGDHTFEVRSADAAGNTDQTPAIRTFRVDTVASDTSISSGPTGTITTASATFEFSSADGVSFECKLDTGSFESCTSPHTYSSLAQGDHTFEVRSTDAAGNVDQSPAIRTFRVDTVAPDTTIDSGISGLTSGNDPSFGFSSTDPAATFECRLDDGSFEPCTSTKNYTDLPDGDHTFEVRAVDGSGNVDQTPASRSFSIDTTAPDTSISSGPTGTITVDSATFAFSSAEGVAFGCSLDGAAFETCTSAKTYSSLTQGPHTFEVRAIDAIGNVDPTPALRTFNVDTGAPETQIVDAPSGTITSTTSTFEFSSDDPGAGFQCSLDGSSFLLTPCTSPFEYSNLGEGEHTFAVRAVDTAGNVDTSPATATFTVDSMAPQTTIDAGPSGLTDDNDPSFVFSADADTVSFECSLDGAPFQLCTSGESYSDLADGAHTFEVRAIDEVGNVDATPDQTSFTIDTVAPSGSVSIDVRPGGLIAQDDVTFEFSTPEPDVTFECSLDGAAFAVCTSPQTYTDLDDGEHTFEVRIVDEAGNAGSQSSATFTVDTTPPDAPTIDRGPEGLTRNDDPTFEFSTVDATDTFECSFDGAEFASCSSPFAQTNLAQGAHSFAVRATDQVGNTGAVTHVDFTVDSIAPGSPTIGAAPNGVIDHNDVTFEFSSDDATNTFECSLNGALWSACTSPVDYVDLPDGSHTVGIRVIDSAGNPSDSTVIAFDVDTTAPETSIDSGPGPITNSTSVEFQLDANEPATFECRLDGGTFGTCPAAPIVPALEDGPHTFEARAIDVVGNIDQSPASYSFTVDTQGSTPPTIESGPSGSIAFDDVSFGFSSAESDVTFECALDGGFVDCTSEWSYTDVAEGTHTFQVRSVDSAGNASAPASRTFEVDTRPPDAPTIEGAPSGTINSRSTSFSFSSQDGSSYRCRMDALPFTECSSGEGFGDLTDGSHTFEVYAVDAAGNAGPSTSVTFSVDTTAPGVVSITTAPRGTITSDSTSVSFTSVDADSFECSLDGGAFEACGSPQGYSGLSEGDHVISVRALDDAGNPGPSSSVGFTVDTVAPGTVAVAAGPNGLINESTVTLELDSSAPGDTFLCSVDGSEFAACSATEVVSGLSEGGHEIQVRTTDGSGRVGDVTTISFTVDTVAPGVTTIGGVPTETVTVDDVSLTFSTGDPSDDFLCSVDGGEYFDCDDSQTFTNLPDGAHTVSVAAVDQAGNIGPVATTAFVVDADRASGGGSSPGKNTPDPVPSPPSETAPDAPSDPGPAVPGPSDPVPATGGTDGSEPVPSHNSTTLKPRDDSGRTGSGLSDGGSSGTEPSPGRRDDGGATVTRDGADQASGSPELATGEITVTIRTATGLRRSDVRPSKDAARKGKSAIEDHTKDPVDGERPGGVRGTDSVSLGQRTTIAQPHLEWQELAAETAKTLGFPLALMILVVLYLLTQYWMDRDDPKLAVAPVNAKYDVVRFE